MSSDRWSKLARELDRWAEAGRVATLWWRDDDAVEPSAKLDLLLETAGGVPLSLAVIPALAGPPLAARLAGSPSVAVLQHGWRHFNHSFSGAMSEYPAHRPDREVAEEFAAGRERLAYIFGDRALAAFVPPWHGFNDRFLPLLAAQGIRSVSRKGPRAAARLGDLITQVNVHVVLINWSDPPAFGGDDQALTAIIDHLRARRMGEVDGGEPTGLLTHHLVQDEASYRFLVTLIALVSSHPAAAWLDSRSFFE